MQSDKSRQETALTEAEQQCRQTMSGQETALQRLKIAQADNVQAGTALQRLNRSAIRQFQAGPASDRGRTAV